MNRHHVCPSMPGVQLLGKSDSIKYLGIPFSQSPVDDCILESLDQPQAATTPAGALVRAVSSFGGFSELDDAERGAAAVDSSSRHGDMIKWRHASIWWKSTLAWWHRTRWEITWRDLPSDERAVDGLRQPIWFNCDVDLQYE
ncbi:hypothetical protein PybrP1_006682 [[Pythium] brassicae (nom. inval.)]|nr:hypothetical protein PybrP1_006682 [[Pythium] brassicae (nom. inval.)]